MRPNIILLIIALIPLLSSCHSLCSGRKIRFGLIYANTGDHLRLYIDGTIQEEKTIQEDFSSAPGEADTKLFNYCTDKDSVLIKVQFNNRDTSFYIHPKDVTECYVGNSIQYRIYVYYKRVIGGYGAYSPIR